MGAGASKNSYDVSSGEVKKSSKKYALADDVLYTDDHSDQSQLKRVSKRLEGEDEHGFAVSYEGSMSMDGTAKHDGNSTAAVGGKNVGTGKDSKKKKEKPKVEKKEKKQKNSKKEESKSKKEKSKEKGKDKGKEKQKQKESKQNNVSATPNSTDIAPLGAVAAIGQKDSDKSKSNENDKKKVSFDKSAEEIKDEVIQKASVMTVSAEPKQVDAAKHSKDDSERKDSTNSDLTNKVNEHIQDKTKDKEKRESFVLVDEPHDFQYGFQVKAMTAGDEIDDSDSDNDGGVYDFQTGSYKHWNGDIDDIPAQPMGVSFTSDSELESFEKAEREIAAQEISQTSKKNDMVPQVHFRDDEKKTKTIPDEETTVTVTETKYGRQVSFQDQKGKGRISVYDLPDNAFENNFDDDEDDDEGDVFDMEKVEKAEKSIISHSEPPPNQQGKFSPKEDVKPSVQFMEDDSKPPQDENETSVTIRETKYGRQVSFQDDRGRGRESVYDLPDNAFDHYDDDSDDDDDTTQMTYSFTPNANSTPLEAIHEQKDKLQVDKKYKFEEPDTMASPINDNNPEPFYDLPENGPTERMHYEEAITRFHPFEDEEDGLFSLPPNSEVLEQLNFQDVYTSEYLVPHRTQQNLSCPDLTFDRELKISDKPKEGQDDFGVYENGEVKEGKKNDIEVPPRYVLPQGPNELMYEDVQEEQHLVKAKSPNEEKKMENDSFGVYENNEMKNGKENEMPTRYIVPQGPDELMYENTDDFRPDEGRVVEMVKRIEENIITDDNDVEIFMNGNSPDKEVAKGQPEVKKDKTSDSPKPPKRKEADDEKKTKDDEKGSDSKEKKKDDEYDNVVVIKKEETINVKTNPAPKEDSKKSASSKSDVSDKKTEDKSSKKGKDDKKKKEKQEKEKKKKGKAPKPDKTKQDEGVIEPMVLATTSAVAASSKEPQKGKSSTVSGDEVDNAKGHKPKVHTEEEITEDAKVKFKNGVTTRVQLRTKTTQREPSQRKSIGGDKTSSKKDKWKRSSDPGIWETSIVEEHVFITINGSEKIGKKRSFLGLKDKKKDGKRDASPEPSTSKKEKKGEKDKKKPKFYEKSSTSSKDTKKKKSPDPPVTNQKEEKTVVHKTESAPLSESKGGKSKDGKKDNKLTETKKDVIVKVEEPKIKNKMEEEHDEFEQPEYSIVPDEEPFYDEIHLEKVITTRRAPQIKDDEDYDVVDRMENPREQIIEHELKQEKGPTTNLKPPTFPLPQIYVNRSANDDDSGDDFEPIPRKESLSVNNRIPNEMVHSPPPHHRKSPTSFPIEEPPVNDETIPVYATVVKPPMDEVARHRSMEEKPISSDFELQMDTDENYEIPVSPPIVPLKNDEVQREWEKDGTKKKDENYTVTIETIEQHIVIDEPEVSTKAPSTEMLKEEPVPPGRRKSKKESDEPKDKKREGEKDSSVSIETIEKHIILEEMIKDEEKPVKSELDHKDLKIELVEDKQERVEDQKETKKNPETGENHKPMATKKKEKDKNTSVEITETDVMITLIDKTVDDVKKDRPEGKDMPRGKPDSPKDSPVANKRKNKDRVDKDKKIDDVKKEDSPKPKERKKKRGDENITTEIVETHIHIHKNDNATDNAKEKERDDAGNMDPIPIGRKKKSKDSDEEKPKQEPKETSKESKAIINDYDERIILIPPPAIGDSIVVKDSFEIDRTLPQESVLVASLEEIIQEDKNKVKKKKDEKPATCQDENDKQRKKENEKEDVNPTKEKTIIEIEIKDEEIFVKEAPKLEKEPSMGNPVTQQDEKNIDKQRKKDNEKEVKPPKEKTTIEIEIKDEEIFVKEAPKLENEPIMDTPEKKDKNELNLKLDLDDMKKEDDNDWDEGPSRVIISPIDFVRPKYRPRSFQGHTNGSPQRKQRHSWADLPARDDPKLDAQHRRLNSRSFDETNVEASTRDCKHTIDPNLPPQVQEKVKKGILVGTAITCALQNGKSDEDKVNAVIPCDVPKVKPVNEVPKALSPRTSRQENEHLDFLQDNLSPLDHDLNGEVPRPEISRALVRKIRHQERALEESGDPDRHSRDSDDIVIEVIQPVKDSASLKTEPLRKDKTDVDGQANTDIKHQNVVQDKKPEANEKKIEKTKTDPPANVTVIEHTHTHIDIKEPIKDPKIKENKGKNDKDQKKELQELPKSKNDDTVAKADKKKDVDDNRGPEKIDDKKKEVKKGVDKDTKTVDKKTEDKKPDDIKKDSDDVNFLVIKEEVTHIVNKIKDGSNLEKPPTEPTLDKEHVEISPEKVCTNKTEKEHFDRNEEREKQRGKIETEIIEETIEKAPLQAKQEKIVDDGASKEKGKVPKEKVSERKDATQEKKEPKKSDEKTRDKEPHKDDVLIIETTDTHITINENIPKQLEKGGGDEKGPKNIKPDEKAKERVEKGADENKNKKSVSKDNDKKDVKPEERSTGKEKKQKSPENEVVPNMTVIENIHTHIDIGEPEKEAKPDKDKDKKKTTSKDEDKQPEIKRVNEKEHKKDTKKDDKSKKDKKSDEDEKKAAKKDDKKEKKVDEIAKKENSSDVEAAANVTLIENVHTHIDIREPQKEASPKNVKKDSKKDEKSKEKKDEKPVEDDKKEKTSKKDDKKDKKVDEKEKKEKSPNVEAAANVTLIENVHTHIDIREPQKENAKKDTKKDDKSKEKDGSPKNAKKDTKEEKSKEKKNEKPVEDDKKEKASKKDDKKDKKVDEKEKKEKKRESPEDEAAANVTLIEAIHTHIDIREPQKENAKKDTKKDDKSKEKKNEKPAEDDKKEKTTSKKGDKKVDEKEKKQKSSDEDKKKEKVASKNDDNKDEKENKEKDKSFDEEKKKKEKPVTKSDDKQQTKTTKDEPKNKEKEVSKTVIENVHTHVEISENEGKKPNKTGPKDAKNKLGKIYIGIEDSEDEDADKGDNHEMVDRRKRLDYILSPQPTDIIFRSPGQSPPRTRRKLSEQQKFDNDEFDEKVVGFPTDDENNNLLSKSVDTGTTQAEKKPKEECFVTVPTVTMYTEVIRPIVVSNKSEKSKEDKTPENYFRHHEDHSCRYGESGKSPQPTEVTSPEKRKHPAMGKYEFRSLSPIHERKKLKYQEKKPDVSPRKEKEEEPKFVFTAEKKVFLDSNDEESPTFKKGNEGKEGGSKKKGDEKKKDKPKKDKDSVTIETTDVHLNIIDRPIAQDSSPVVGSSKEEKKDKTKLKQTKDNKPPLESITIETEDVHYNFVDLPKANKTDSVIGSARLSSTEMPHQAVIVHSPKSPNPPALKNEHDKKTDSEADSKSPGKGETPGQNENKDKKSSDVKQKVDPSKDKKEIKDKPNPDELGIPDNYGFEIIEAPLVVATVASSQESAPNKDVDSSKKGKSAEDLLLANIESQIVVSEVKDDTKVNPEKDTTDGPQNVKNDEKKAEEDLASKLLKEKERKIKELEEQLEAMKRQKMEKPVQNSVAPASFGAPEDDYQDKSKPLKLAQRYEELHQNHYDSAKRAIGQILRKETKEFRLRFLCDIVQTSYDLTKQQRGQVEDTLIRSAMSESGNLQMPFMQSFFTPLSGDSVSALKTFSQWKPDKSDLSWDYQQFLNSARSLMKKSSENFDPTPVVDAVLEKSISTFLPKQSSKSFQLISSPKVRSLVENVSRLSWQFVAQNPPMELKSYTEAVSQRGWTSNKKKKKGTKKEQVRHEMYHTELHERHEECLLDALPDVDYVITFYTWPSLHQGESLLVKGRVDIEPQMSDSDSD